MSYLLQSNEAPNGDGSNCSTPTTCGGIMEEIAGQDCKEPGANSQPGSWPNLQETLQFERAASAIMADQQQHQQMGPPGSQQQGGARRPHTISAAYGQPQTRPALGSYHFSPPPSSPAPDGQVNFNACFPSECCNNVVYFVAESKPKAPIWCKWKTSCA
jgi:hypothetical protein